VHKRGGKFSYVVYFFTSDVPSYLIVSQF